jgi:hypothetical protein
MHMEKIDYETARKKFDEGYDCFGRLNDTGKAALTAFAADFYKDAGYDPETVFSQVERTSARLMIPCGSPLMEFARDEGGHKVIQNFRLLPAQFDWFVR